MDGVAVDYDLIRRDIFFPSVRVFPPKADAEQARAIFGKLFLRSPRPFP